MAVLFYRKSELDTLRGLNCTNSVMLFLNSVILMLYLQKMLPQQNDNFVLKLFYLFYMCL